MRKHSGFVFSVTTIRPNQNAKAQNCEAAERWKRARERKREHESRFMLPLPTNHQSGKTTETSIYASRCERFDHFSLPSPFQNGGAEQKKKNK